MNKKITIITVCYNAKSEIEKTMKSVLSQSYDNIEYIIIDGASTDNTLEIVNSLVSKYISRNVQIFSEPDKGIFDAMNKGIEKATGEWINFMNAGDVFYNEQVIEKVFKSEISDNVGVIFGDTYTENGPFKMLPFIYNPQKLCGMGISHQSLFVRTSLAKNNPFDMSFKVAADYNMIRQIYNQGYDFKRFDMPISVYDLNGYSAHNVIRQIDETAIICNQYHSFLHYKARLFKQCKCLIKKILRR